MGGGGGTSQSWDAGENFAQAARDQYDIGSALAGTPNAALRGALKGKLMPQTLQGARDAASQGFAAQRQAMGLDLARRGIAPDAQQQGAMNRSLDLAQASASAGLENAARLHNQSRRLGILSGGLGSNLVAQQMSKR